MTDPQQPGRRTSRFTVQGWLIVVLTTMGAVVVAGAIVGGLLLKRADDVSRELSENLQPARVAAYQLQAALRDQETALRGYVIAADRQFLEPYYQGQRDEAVAAEVIRTRAGGHDKLMSDLDGIEKAAEQWRRNYADPLIANVRPGTPSVLSNELAERGKTEFDVIRSLFETQNADMSRVRDEGLAEQDSISRWRDGILAAMIAAFFLTALLLAVLVRNAVTIPLEALASSCRRITEGDFDEKIIPQGPKDIRGIAADVEDMRQRIVEELEATRSARQMLDDQAVELLRSNAELEQFAYVASHDLQEPLRKVASFCQLLEKRYGDQLDERGHEYIGFAVDGAKRMQVLINDLLTFSRVGRINTTLVEVDLDEIMDSAEANLDTALEESHAEIVRPTDLPAILGDPTLLTMLWQNLIGNAVKFRNPDRAPRVVVEFAADDAGMWSFTVSDNGIGIAPEFSEKVFVIFQRLHGRDSYGGTGIGLALCKKIVEFHGGTIWIDTAYTGGTRFRFTLPATVDESAAVTEEGSHA